MRERDLISLMVAVFIVLITLASWERGFKKEEETTSQKRNVPMDHLSI